MQENSYQKLKQKMKIIAWKLICRALSMAKFQKLPKNVHRTGFTGD